MPIQSDFTTMLGEELQLELDAIGEALKEQIGWPALGVQQLSPSGLRARDDRSAQQLADYLEQLGMEGAIELLKGAGQQIIDGYGAEVLQEAVQIANVAWLHALAKDGREDLIA